VKQAAFMLPPVSRSKLGELVYWKLQEEFSSEIIFFYDIISVKQENQGWKVEILFFRDDNLLKDLNYCSSQGIPVKSIRIAELGFQSCNFLPMNYKEKAKLWDFADQALKIMAMTIISLLVGILCFWGMTLHTQSEIRKGNAAILGWSAEKRAAVENDSSIRKIKELVYRSQALNDQKARSAPVIVQIGNLVPRDVRLTELRGSLSDGLMELRGEAGTGSDVLHFVDLLKKSFDPSAVELKKLTGRDDGRIDFMINLRSEKR
jgi:hypothetical protein